MKKIQTIIFFDVIPLTNADSFLMQDNVNVILCDLRTKLGVFLRLKSLKNNAFFTIWVMFSNINRIYFFFFSIQNIKRNCSIILSNIPRSSFSGGKLIPSQLIYLWNVLFLSSFADLFFFLFPHNLTWLLWHIESIYYFLLIGYVTFPFFIQSRESIYDPPWFIFILWHL